MVVLVDGLLGCLADVLGVLDWFMLLRMNESFLSLVILA